jgi:K+-transporting ATPase ATPase C chain
MTTEFRRGILFTAISLVIVGAYHVVLWGIGTALFPEQASGSLIRRADGTVVGSALIAQKFATPAYFQPRPSAVDYNAASTGGSNYGPANPDHLNAVKERIDAMTALENVGAADVPSEMVTASGAGLDPHIPPAAALMQVNRVAAARGIAADRVRALVESAIEPPQLGFLGRARVNVLRLNLALDQAIGAPAPAPPPVSH